VIGVGTPTGPRSQGAPSPRPPVRRARKISDVQEPWKVCCGGGEGSMSSKKRICKHASMPVEGGVWDSEKF